MSTESVRKRGYLYKLPVKGFVKKWTRRWFILYATTHEGVVRIEYYDSKESAVNEIGKRTIPLRDSLGLELAAGNKIHPYVFRFNSQLGQHILAAESQPELDDWMDSIKDAVHEDSMRRRKKKTQSLVIAGEADIAKRDAESSGSSYKSNITSGTYRVTIEENDTSLKMNLWGEYNLIVGLSSLSLVGANSGATIFKLHFKFLKNYGKQSGQFHFETGRSSPVGPGQFICVTTCSKEIFGVVHRNIKKLRADNQKKVDPKSAPAQGSAKQLVKKQKNSASQQPISTQKSNPVGGSLRPSSRHSTSEIADDPVEGKYRSSKDLEEVAIGGMAATDPSAVQGNVNYSLATAAADPFTVEENKDNYSLATAAVDPSSLYSKVNKKKASTVDDTYSSAATPDKNIATDRPKPSKSAPTPPKPYSGSAKRESSHDVSYEEPNAEEENNPKGEIDEYVSYNPAKQTSVENSDYTTMHPIQPTPFDNARDSRASVALVNLGESAFFDSFDDDDGDYDETLSPLKGGVDNPFSGNTEMGAENFADLDLEQLDANFFEQLEAMDLQGGAVGAGATGLSGGVAVVPQQDQTLNQQEFDSIWGNISHNMPNIDDMNFFDPLQ